MSRPNHLRPALLLLEERWLPSSGLYPDAARNALQASYVSQAQQADNPVVFLGDSITYNWGTAARKAPGSPLFTTDFATLNAANFGVIGDTTSELAARIEGGDLAGKPKVAVVLIGFNDLNQGSTAAQAAAGVASILRDIRTSSPSTSIVLLGTLPSDDSAVNPEIQELDSMISRYGNDPGVVYLNPGSQLLGSNGAAQSNLLSDGVHPNLAGYNLIAGSIDGTVVKLLSEADYVADRPIPPPLANPIALPSPSPTPATPPVLPVLASPEILTIPEAAGPVQPSTGSTKLVTRFVGPILVESNVDLDPAVDIPDIIEAPSAIRSRSDSGTVGINSTT